MPEAPKRTSRSVFNPGSSVPPLWLMVFCVLPCCVADAQPSAVPKSPEGAFEVHEWVIFICDPNQPQANAGSLFLSTLPDFMAGRRTAAAVEKLNEPTPIGLIRFTGNSGGEKVDVLLENKGGRFLGHWPKAQTRTNGLLWQNLMVSDQPAGATAADALAAASWINRLRAPAAPALLREGKGERFLLYDAEPNYKLPLRVLPGDAELHYQVTNSDKVGLKDLTFYKKLPDGWHSATVGDLPPSSPTTKPATKPATAPMAPTTLAASRPTTAPATLAATKPATSPTTLAASQPSTKPTVGLPIALAASDAASDAALLAPWKARLTAAGLQATDLDLIIGILEKQALDANRLTAVYRLEADQLDQLLPLDIVPSPRKTVRVGLVIVRNIDPAIATEIETLVAQLGDVKWDAREAAQKRLTDLGLAARPKLELLLKSARDPEVVYRIERLIAALTRDPAPGTDVNPQIDR